MPSPLGHALAGAAAGWAVAGSRPPSAPRDQFWRLGACFALLGMVPDVDLAVQVHRGVTHSLGAAVMAGVVAGLVARRVRIGAAAAAAYATHILLDWLAADTSVPLGVMALWPFSSKYYLSHVELFHSIWRRNETPDFWTHNVKAILRELIILAPPFLLMLRWRASVGRRDQYL